MEDKEVTDEKKEEETEGKLFTILFGVILVVGLLVVAGGVLKPTGNSPQEEQVGAVTEAEKEDGADVSEVGGNALGEDISALDVTGYDVAGSKGDGKPVILMLGASWCNPCKQMRPGVEEIFEEYSDRVTIRYIDVDTADREMMEEYPLEVVPTQYFFNSEKEPLEALEFMGPGTGWVMFADSEDESEQEHILTGHQGYLSKEAMEMLIEVLGVE